MDLFHILVGVFPFQPFHPGTELFYALYSHLSFLSPDRSAHLTNIWPTCQVLRI